MIKNHIPQRVLICGLIYGCLFSEGKTSVYPTGDAAVSRVLLLGLNLVRVSWDMEAVGGSVGGRGSDSDGDKLPAQTGNKDLKQYLSPDQVPPSMLEKSTSLQVRVYTSLYNIEEEIRCVLKKR